VLHKFINAGIYLIDPGVLACIPKGQPFDMPDLIESLLSAGRRVASFPLHEYWLDIQEYDDYRRVLADAERGLLGDLTGAVASLEPGAPPPAGVIPLCVPEIRGNEWAYVKECLDTNWVSSVGPFVDRFEEIVARYSGTKFGVAASSGTAALHIALLVSGVQPDDEVLVSDLTFIAPANAIRYAGAWPIFIDAEPDFWQMDPQKVADFLDRECRWEHGALHNRKTNRRVRAIMPVHALGHPVDMDAILVAARKYHLVVIEDATESLGAGYKDRRVGQLSDIAVFSFNGNKVITTGGGGMIVTDNEAWARKARYLTTQAKDDPLEYLHNEIGYNYRLTNLQAALGCAQMEQIDDYIAIKRRLAEVYTQSLAEVDGITPMRQAEWATSIFWMATILVDEARYGMDSRALLRALARANIQTRPLWQPMHLSPAHASCQAYRCEVSEQLYRRALSLPSSAGLTVEQQQKVIGSIRNLVNPCSNA
jgi:perosamine synthetase